MHAAGAAPVIRAPVPVGRELIAMQISPLGYELQRPATEFTDHHGVGGDCDHRMVPAVDGRGHL
jgi:hypothetical protein